MKNKTVKTELEIINEMKEIVDKINVKTDAFLIIKNKMYNALTFIKELQIMTAENVLEGGERNLLPLLEEYVQVLNKPMGAASSHVVVDLPNIVNTFAFNDINKHAGKGKIQFFTPQHLRKLLDNTVFNNETDKIQIYTTPKYYVINDYLKTLKLQYPQIEIVMHAREIVDPKTNKTVWEDIDDLLINHFKTLSDKVCLFDKLVLLGADWQYSSYLEAFFLETGIPIEIVCHEDSVPAEYIKLSHMLPPDGANLIAYSNKDLEA